MVQLAGFSAINEQQDAAAAALTQTLEAQEARVVECYERALGSVRSKDLNAAEAAFRQVLADPLVEAGTSEQLQRINYLALKNLAALLAQDPLTSSEALMLYQEAAFLDGTDIVIWDRLGSLAATQGVWSLAKYAFQKGLQRDPTHPTLADKLLQMLVHVGDISTAVAFSKGLLTYREHHALARKIVKMYTEDETMMHSSSVSAMTAVDIVASSGCVSLLQMPSITDQLERARAEEEHQQRYFATVNAAAGGGGVGSTRVQKLEVEAATWEALLVKCSTVLAKQQTTMNGGLGSSSRSVQRPASAAGHQRFLFTLPAAAAPAAAPAVGVVHSTGPGDASVFNSAAGNTNANVAMDVDIAPAQQQQANDNNQNATARAIPAADGASLGGGQTRPSDTEVVATTTTTTTTVPAGEQQIPSNPTNLEVVGDTTTTTTNNNNNQQPEISAATAGAGPSATTKETVRKSVPSAGMRLPTRSNRGKRKFSKDELPSAAALALQKQREQEQKEEEEEDPFYVLSALAPLLPQWSASDSPTSGENGANNDEDNNNEGGLKKDENQDGLLSPSSNQQQQQGQALSRPGSAQEVVKQAEAVATAAAVHAFVDSLPKEGLSAGQLSWYVVHAVLGHHLNSCTINKEGKGSSISPLRQAATSEALVHLMWLLHRDAVQCPVDQRVSPHAALVLGELFAEAAMKSSLAQQAQHDPSSQTITAAGVKRGGLAPTGPNINTNTNNNNNTRITATTLGGASSQGSQPSLEQLQRCAVLWLARFRSGKLGTIFTASITRQQEQQQPNNNPNSNNTDNAMDVLKESSLRKDEEGRYWWARGRVEESADATHAMQAAACYSNCTTALQASGLTEIKMQHCQFDACISGASIKGKLEVLRLYDVLFEAQSVLKRGFVSKSTSSSSLRPKKLNENNMDIDQDQDQLNNDEDGEEEEEEGVPPSPAEQAQRAQHAITLLRPVLLSCDDKEKLMARMDLRKWLYALKLLMDSANKSNDVVLLLQCHLRILGTLLPAAVPAWEEGILKSKNLKKKVRDDDDHVEEEAEERENENEDDDEFSLLEVDATAATMAVEQLCRSDTGGALFAFSSFLKQHAKDLKERLLEEPQGMQTVEWKMLQSTCHQLLSALQSCVLCPWLGKSGKTGRLSSLSTKMTASRLAMADASCALLALLDIPTPPPSSSFGSGARNNQHRTASPSHTRIGTGTDDDDDVLIADSEEEIINDQQEQEEDNEAVVTPSKGMAVILSPEDILTATSTLCRALGDAGGLSSRQGLFVEACMGRLRNGIAAAEAEIVKLKEQEQAKGSKLDMKKKAKIKSTDTNANVAGQAADDDDDDDEEKELDTLASLHSGLHHCMYWLYGVRLPGLDDQIWGGAAAPEDDTNTNNNINLNAPMTATTTAVGGGGGGGGVLPSVQMNMLLTTSASGNMPSSGPLRRLSSPEDALEIWNLVVDHLLTQTPAVLNAKYRDFVDQVAHFFPAPAVLVNACTEAWCSLEAQPPPEIHPKDASPTANNNNNNNPMLGIIQSALTRSSVIKQQQQREDAELGVIDTSSSNLPHLLLTEQNMEMYGDLYKTLFYIQAVMQPSLEDELKNQGNILMTSPASDAVLESILRPYKMDLCFNPTRTTDGWIFIGDTYHYAADLLLDHAVEHLPYNEWPRRTDLHSRFSRYRALGHWSHALATTYLQADTSNSNTADVDIDILEDTAERYYYDLQDLPPMYDQLQSLPDKESAIYQGQCARGLRAYQAASHILPDEWVFHLRLGELKKMQGKPPEDCLPHMAIACRCAAVFTTGLIDPVYAVHAERMDSVLTRLSSSEEDGENVEERLKKDVELLRLLGKYSFSPEAHTAAATTLLENLPSSLASSTKKMTKKDVATVQQTVQELKKVVLEDCGAAFQWCLDKDRYFHPATYSLAVVKLHLSGPQAALTELSALFTKPKTAFCINVYQVMARSGGDGGGSRGGKGGKKERKSGAASGSSTAGDGKTQITDVPESDYAQPPTSKTVGVGLPERIRTFWSRLKRAMYLYLFLLLKTNNLDALIAATTFFSTNKDWKDIPLAPVARFAGGCYTVALLNAAQSQICSLDRLMPSSREASPIGGADVTATATENAQQQQQQQQGIVGFGDTSGTAARIEGEAEERQKIQQEEGETTTAAAVGAVVVPSSDAVHPLLVSAQRVRQHRDKHLTALASELSSSLPVPLSSSGGAASGPPTFVFVDEEKARREQQEGLENILQRCYHLWMDHTLLREISSTFSSTSTGGGVHIRGGGVYDGQASSGLNIPLNSSGGTNSTWRTTIIGPSQDALSPGTGIRCYFPHALRAVDTTTRDLLPHSAAVFKAYAELYLAWLGTKPGTHDKVKLATLQYKRRYKSLRLASGEVKALGRLLTLAAFNTLTRDVDELEKEAIVYRPQLAKPPPPPPPMNVQPQLDAIAATLQGLSTSATAAAASGIAASQRAQEHQQELSTLAAQLEAAPAEQKEQQASLLQSRMLTLAQLVQQANAEHASKMQLVGQLNVQLQEQMSKQEALLKVQKEGQEKQREFEREQQALMKVDGNTSGAAAAAAAAAALTSVFAPVVIEGGSYVMSTAESDLLEKVLTALKTVQAFYKSLSWLQGAAPAAEISDITTRTEQLMLRMLRAHRLLDRQPDTSFASVSEALKTCDELIKAQRRQSMKPLPPSAAATGTVPAEQQQQQQQQQQQILPLPIDDGGEDQLLIGRKRDRVDSFLDGSSTDLDLLPSSVLEGGPLYINQQLTGEEGRKEEAEERSPSKRRAIDLSSRPLAIADDDDDDTEDNDGDGEDIDVVGLA